MSRFFRIFNHKFVLGFCNVNLLACGIVLFISGSYLFTDGPRMLLSRLLVTSNPHLAELPYPFFYYIALGLATAGLLAICASIIGCWAFCIHTYCVLSIYFIIVLLLLLCEFAACLMISIWPQCMGLELDETAMVKALQGYYGVPGNEQFTAALDLAQTYFECCAMNSNINYDTSMWRLQSFGKREWTVPLTCCKLMNKKEPSSYLDPIPVNLTQCQSLQRNVYELSRHNIGCLDKLDEWYRQQYVLFLGASLILAIVEFCVLLSIILNCLKFNSKPVSHHKYVGTTLSNPLSNVNRVEQERRENVYEEDLSTPGIPIFPMEVKKLYVQPPDLCNSRRSTIFNKSNSSKYPIANSYLV